MSDVHACLATITTQSDAQTAALAQKLAPVVRVGDTLTLSGDLGAGKTVFARALIQALAQKPEQVTSPTFTLMQSYGVQLQGKPHTLWHCDFYRLDDAREAQQLGIEELMAEHVTLIEWPENIAPYLPVARLDVRLAYGASENQRQVRFFGLDAWQDRLKAVL